MYKPAQFDVEVIHRTAEKLGFPFRKQSAEAIFKLALAVGLNELKMTEIDIVINGKLLVFNRDPA